LTHQRQRLAGSPFPGIVGGLDSADTRPPPPIRAGSRGGRRLPRRLASHLPARCRTGPPASCHGRDGAANTP
jgi:hypothetical protein